MATKIFNLSLPQELVDIIDQQAKLRFSTRREYIKQAIIARLKKDGLFDAPSTPDASKTLAKLKRQQLSKSLLAWRKQYPIREMEDLN